MSKIVNGWSVGNEGDEGWEPLRGNTRFELWGRAIRDIGLCTPARDESCCEGGDTSQWISDGQVVSSHASEKISQFSVLLSNRTTHTVEGKRSRNGGIMHREDRSGFYFKHR